MMTSRRREKYYLLGIGIKDWCDDRDVWQMAVDCSYAGGSET